MIKAKIFFTILFLGFFFFGPHNLCCKVDPYLDPLGSHLKNVLEIPNIKHAQPMGYYFSDKLIVVPKNDGSIIIFEKSNGNWLKPQTIKSQEDFIGWSPTFYVDYDQFYYADNSSLYLFTKVNEVWTKKELLKGSFDNISIESRMLFLSHVSDKETRRLNPRDNKSLVYIYEKAADGILKLAETLPSPIEVKNHSGSSIAGNNNLLVFGSSKSIHIYERKDKTWMKKVILENEDAGPYETPYNIILSENCFVTAESGIPDGIDIYCNNGIDLSEPTYVESPEFSSRIGFGRGFFLRGNYLIVGSGHSPTMGRPLATPDGRAFLFSRSTSGKYEYRTELSQHLGLLRNSDHRFGNSVYLSQDSIYVTDGSRIYEFSNFFESGEKQ